MACIFSCESDYSGEGMCTPSAKVKDTECLESGHWAVKERGG